MSKYIPNPRIHKPFSYTWKSSAKENKEELNAAREYRQQMLTEKNRVESISLGQLSFKDLYKFPFKKSDHSSWVYDDKGNFIFQFENDTKGFQKKVLEILNEETLEYNRREVRVEGGFVQAKIEGSWVNLLLIRGWGNLTGAGAYNLDGEYAAKIQESLAEYIVEKLNIK